ncbi:Mu transposase C-terminal domain-containing protein [Herbaspirillum seropedicae]|uniref:Mu transposase C-terminal domain-containing protein n=1 Tax=Herbaspirillum seropedicae TaxID=964 RepID=UPI0009F374EC|nr:Mu transposase C-terminal domain-containing protein [Herbaspirillum seropedicae]
MMHSLRLHDRLVDPRSQEVYLEVLDVQLHGGCVKVFDSAQKTDRYIELAAIAEDIHVGTLMVLRKGKPRHSHAEQYNDDHLHQKDHFVRGILYAIQDRQSQDGVSFLRAYRHVEQAYKNKKVDPTFPFPSQAAIYRYHQADIAGLPILRGDKNKGNRSSRYSSEVIDTILQIASEHYLQPHSRWTLIKIAASVNRRVQGIYLPPGHPPISPKYVKAVITRHACTDPEATRMLPKDAIAGKSIAKKRIRAEQPLERVEQDALHLPFVVRTPNGVTSEVYLVLAIDCCTGFPLGWRLVVGTPTDTDTLACIEMYMSPVAREHGFMRLGLTHKVSLYGTPGQIIFDNGPENRSGRILRLQRIGSDVQYCKSRAGQEKPFVERTNRSIKEDLEVLPGCTRLDGVDGKRDPVSLGEDLMDLEELELWVVRWLYEKWIHKPLDRLLWDAVLVSSVEGVTPAERWAHFQDSCSAIPLPPSRAEWMAVLYEHVERKINRKTGVTVEGLHYKGDAVSYLIQKYGEQRSLRILFDPDDFRQIYVYEGDDYPLVTLIFEHLRPETPAWSFKEAKERHRQKKVGHAQALEYASFEQELDERATGDASSCKRKSVSKRERNRSTTKRTRAVDALKRASKSPNPPVSKSRSKVIDSPGVEQPNNLQLEETGILDILSRHSGEKLC